MNQSRLRFPLMALAMAAMLAGLWAGLVRLGWRWPAPGPALATAHGAIMVAGFLGTLIAIERAVALRERWAYTGPALSGVGALLLILGMGGVAGALLVTLGSLWLAVVYIVIVRRHRANYTLLMGAGALALLVGNILWLSGWPVYRLVLWWQAFLILTIAGERLELGRIVRLSENAQLVFLAAVGVYLAGITTSLVSLSAGTRLAGLGMLALAVWLLRHDIARRTIFKEGLPRFAAVCLLSGYAWLGAAGVMGLTFGEVLGGVRYDAFLHAVFLGFVFSMIFGHAPIIFPAIFGVEIRFQRAFYVHLIVLHLSLILRVAGDLMMAPPARLWGGLLNGVAILVFIGMNVFSVLISRRASMGGITTVRDGLPAGQK
jgi:hypothetical protein